MDGYQWNRSNDGDVIYPVSLNPVVAYLLALTFNMSMNQSTEISGNVQKMGKTAFSNFIVTLFAAVVTALCNVHKRGHILSQ